MRVLGRLALALVRIALVLAVTLALLAAALVLLVRSDYGRRALLGLVLERANVRMAGHITAARLEGDLWHSFTLYDVRLDDAEGIEAIYARRVSARIDWPALRHSLLRVEGVDVEGARIYLRHLRDNRLNVAALPLPPRDHVVEEATAPAPPLEVRFEHVRVAVDGAYDPPRGHEGHALERPRGSFFIEASARFRGKDIDIRVDRLISDARDPVQAHVELRGRLHVTPHALPGDRVEITLGDVAVDVTSDGDELGRLDPALRARGRWHGHVEGGGPLADLRAHGVVSPPAGSLRFSGAMTRLLPGIRWRARVEGEGLDPARDWRGLWPGQVAFAVAAAGERRDGAVRLERLRARTGSLTLGGHGELDFRGRGAGELELRAGDLAELRALALPDLDRRQLEVRGQASVRARLERVGGGVRLGAALDASRLRLHTPRFDAALGAVTLGLDSDGRTAALELRAADVAAPRVRIAVTDHALGVALARLHLVARGRPEALHARVEAEAGRAHAVAELDGAVRLDGERRRPRASPSWPAALAAARGAALTLQSLVVDGLPGGLPGGQPGRPARFALAAPATLTLDRAAPQVELRALGAHLSARLAERARDAIADVTLAVPDLASIGRSLGRPLSGALDVSGRLTLDHVFVADAHVSGRDVAVAGARLGRFDAELRTRDRAAAIDLDAARLAWGGVELTRLRLNAHGEGDALGGSFDLEAPDTRVHAALDGRLTRRDGAPVGADVGLHEVDIAWRGGRWQLADVAALRLDERSVSVEHARLRSGAGELRLDGRWRKDGVVNATLALSDGDLDDVLRLFGRAGHLPPARWRGLVHVRGPVRAPEVQARLEARAERAVAWYGLAFNALRVDAFADRRHLSLHLDATGDDEVGLALDGHGTPLIAGDQWIGLDATVERLRLTSHERTWQLKEPCGILFAARFSLAECTVSGGGKAAVTVDGRGPILPNADPTLDLSLEARNLDLREVGGFLAPGHKQPPSTRFAVRAHVGGTPRDPVIDLDLKGPGSQIDEGLPELVDYRIHGHYGHGRVSGDASMRQIGTSLGVGARFDLPLTLTDPKQSLHLELEARPVPFFKLRRLLPTTIADLRGFFTLRLRVDGTVRHPLVSGELHAPSWQLDDLKDNDTVVNLDYDGRTLAINSVTSFAATSFLASLLRIRPTRNSGTVNLEVRAPVDLGLLLERPHELLQAFSHRVPFTASAALKGVALDKVPLQIVGIDTPFTEGRLDGAISLRGTLHRPSLHADLRAFGLGRPGLYDHFDAQLGLAYDDGVARLSGAAQLGGGALMTWHGRVALDAEAVLDEASGQPGRDWRTGALALDLEVPGYRLGRLAAMQPRWRTLSGLLGGRASIRGTWGAPELRAALDVDELHLGDSRFHRVSARAHYRDGAWSLAANGSQQGGGELAFTGAVDRDAAAPLALDLEARRLDTGFLAAATDWLGETHGRIDAAVRIDGTRAHPSAHGSVAVRDGALKLARDPRRYDGGTLDLTFDGRRAELRRFAWRAGDGTLEASGSAELDGWHLGRIALRADARRFAVGYGGAAAWFDAAFTVAGSAGGGGGADGGAGWSGRLTLERGAVVLPEVHGGDLQPVGEMRDVVYADEPRGRRGKAFLLMRLGGPIALRSQELALDLDGELAVALGDGGLRLDGVLEGQNGSVELLGHHYTLERARVAFLGPPNDPDLQLRATRPIAGATLTVEVEGPAHAPRLSLSSDPPIYDQARLVSLFLAGRPGADRIALRELDRQITGLLSAIVIDRVQRQLASKLPIDVVRPLDQQSYAEFSQTPVEVGRYVTDRIYVSYSHQFGSRLGRSAANAAEAHAEYRLGKGFDVATVFGDAGVGGIYLYWTAKY